MSKILGKTQVKGPPKVRPVENLKKIATTVDKFDQETCIRLAGISSAAYKSEKVIVHDLRALGMGFHNYELISNDNAQAYIIWNDKELVVAWRGTEPTEYKDVLADLKFKKVVGIEGMVHKIGRASCRERV